MLWRRSVARFVTKDFVDSAALKRDVKCLTNLVREGDLSPEIREHLADTLLGLLTGKIRRPSHRPPKESTRESGFEIAMRVLELAGRGWSKRGAAVKQAATEFGCGDRKVWHYLKQFNEYVLHDEFEEERLTRHHIRGIFTDEEMETAKGQFEDWLADHEDRPELTDEEIEAEGDAYLQWVSDFTRGK